MGGLDLNKSTHSSTKNNTTLEQQQIFDSLFDTIDSNDMNRIEFSDDQIHDLLEYMQNELKDITATCMDDLAKVHPSAISKNLMTHEIHIKPGVEPITYPKSKGKVKFFAFLSFCGESDSFSRILIKMHLRIK